MFRPFLGVGTPFRVIFTILSAGIIEAMLTLVTDPIMWQS